MKTQDEDEAGTKKTRCGKIGDGTVAAASGGIWLPLVCFCAIQNVFIAGQKMPKELTEEPTGRGATPAELRLIAFNLKMKSLEMKLGLGTFNLSQQLEKENVLNNTI